MSEISCVILRETLPGKPSEKTVNSKVVPVHKHYAMKTYGGMEV
jgi:hypothetical protein